MGYTIKKFDINGEKLLYSMIKALDITERAGKRLIDKGRVKLDGETVTHKGLRASGEVEVLFYEPTPTNQLMPIFETDDFAVFEKPSFMLSHPNGFHVEECMLDSIKKLYGNTANVTHRLDFETSGLIVASKTKEAESLLKINFENRGMQKEYTALLQGKLEETKEVECLLENIKTLEIKIMQGEGENGKYSFSVFEPLEYFEDQNATLVRIIPKTGRLHQIRVHSSIIGHPIMGEPIYGNDLDTAKDYLDKKLSKEERLRRTKASRICLHASKISFEHKNEHYEISSKTDIRREFLAALFD